MLGSVDPGVAASIAHADCAFDLARTCALLVGSCRQARCYLQHAEIENDEFGHTGITHPRAT